MLRCKCRKNNISVLSSDWCCVLRRSDPVPVVPQLTLSQQLYLLVRSLQIVSTGNEWIICKIRLDNVSTPIILTNACIVPKIPFNLMIANGNRLLLSLLNYYFKNQNQ